MKSDDSSVLNPELKCSSFFGKKSADLTTGCEPCLGDMGCLEVNDEEDDDDNLPPELLKQLKIEESGLTVRPLELERQIL